MILLQSNLAAIDELSADLYGAASVEEGEGEDGNEAGEGKERKRKRKKKRKGTLERLWAYLTIQQLLEKRQVTDSDEVKKRVLELALKVGL